MSNKNVVAFVATMNTQTNMNLFAVIFEVNLVGGNTKEWWVNIRATCYVCSEKKIFSTYNPMSDGEKKFHG